MIIGRPLLLQGCDTSQVIVRWLIPGKQSLQHAKETLRLAQVLTRVDKYTALIIDDIGYVKKDNQETMALYQK